MVAPNEITTTQLSRLIGTPTCPVLVDVTTDEDFADDPFLIPSSFRHSFQNIDGLVQRLEGRKSIIICQKGKKLSQGVAALLRSEGLVSEYLQGGMYGWREMAGMYRVPFAALPAVPSLWVTRQRPKIDRIACPWLIRRFVDPSARFLFVAADDVGAVAERFDAQEFDIKNAFWSHRGEACTFETMLSEFELKSAPLGRMARIIRAADTNRHELAPQAAGLLAISVGLSRQFRDDCVQLEAGMHVYDALYRWARDGVDEGHNCPEGQGTPT